MNGNNFNYETGFEYKLTVKTFPTDSPSNEVAAMQYELLEVVYQEAPIPVEPDGGIGDGAGSIPVEPDGGIGDGAGPIPVEPDGGIGDGSGSIEDNE